MIKIVLADDHRLVRGGIKLLLEEEKDLKVVGEAKNGHEALEQVEQLQPDVLVVDLMMNGMSGFDVIEKLAGSPKTKVVVLSMHNDDAYVAKALKLGAQAYVLKDSAPGALVSAIHKVLHGQRYIAPPLNETAIEEYLRKNASAM